MDLEIFKKKVSTDFMYSGGASFETHIAVSKSKNLFKFNPSTKFALYTLMYLFFCIGGFFLGKHFYFKGSSWSALGLLLFGCTLVFLVAFLYFLKDYLKSIVFNKSSGVFYKGYLNAKFLRDDTTQLDNIIAIQILGEITTEQIAPFNSYELNLVLKDLERIHVIDHADIKSIIEDAEQLSEFLNVPIWTNKSDEH